MININKPIKIKFLNNTEIYKLHNKYNLISYRSSRSLTILDSYDNEFIDKYYLYKFIMYLRKISHISYGNCIIVLNNRIFELSNDFNCMYIRCLINEYMSVPMILPKVF